MTQAATKQSIFPPQSIVSQPSQLTLPKVDQAQVEARPLDLAGVSKRFMNPGELEVLVALMRHVKAREVIEIGVNEGRTARVMLDNVPTIEWYCGIDVPVGYVTAKDVQRREIPRHPGHLAAGDRRFHKLVSLRGSLDLSAGDLRPCDAVFIDGDHGFEAVLHDTLLARSLVRPGGIIIWHDYHAADTVDVRKVLETLHRHGDKISHVDGTWLAFEMMP